VIFICDWSVIYLLPIYYFIFIRYSFFIYFIYVFVYFFSILLLICYLWVYHLCIICVEFIHLKFIDLLLIYHLLYWPPAKSYCAFCVFSWVHLKDFKRIKPFWESLVEILDFQMSFIYLCKACMTYLFISALCAFVSMHSSLHCSTLYNSVLDRYSLQTSAGGCCAHCTKIIWPGA